jgi:Flp pilus assembly protein TadG
MRSLLKGLARFSLLRRQDASAIVEFGLVVPVFFVIVWAVIAFGRGYQRLNVLTGALREGARYGSTLPTCPFSAADEALAEGRMQTYANAFGVTLDMSYVDAFCEAGTAFASASAYPLFSDITFFGLEGQLVTRTARFRWERTP